MTVAAPARAYARVLASLATVARRSRAASQNDIETTRSSRRHSNAASHEAYGYKRVGARVVTQCALGGRVARRTAPQGRRGDDHSRRIRRWIRLPQGRGGGALDRRARWAGEDF